MKEKLNQFLYRFFDPWWYSELLPETPKEWAVTITLCIFLIVLIILAAYVEDLYDAVIQLIETAVK